jgi:hypothetical protein
MIRTFTHPLWKRLYIVDDSGIHEHRGSRVFASIRWEDVAAINRRGALSQRGTRISLRLTGEMCREFEACASQIWRERHPDRWQSYHEASHRFCKRFVYFWFPIVLLAPCMAVYLLYWWIGWPEQLRSEIQKIHRLTILGVVIWIGFSIAYGYRLRKTRIKT